MVIDVHASMRHYAEHLAPVFDALPQTMRGQWLDLVDLNTRDVTRHVLVACWRDAQTVAPSPLLYVEHGAGQSYEGDARSAGNGSYSGGDGLGRVRLFMCPNPVVAGRWAGAYPGAATAVVGCPKLDRWHRLPPKTPGEFPTVAITFHWECALIPETRSTWRHYDPALHLLRDDPRWDLLGHGHPRIWGVLRRRWLKLGVEPVEDFAEILERADLLVADNTSAAYEFASTGRPVLVLNAPWYRRDIDHGLRFWDYPPGLQCDHSGDLPGMIAEALADHPAAQAIRARAVAAAYAYTDGHAAERAAEAIQETI